MNNVHSRDGFYCELLLCLLISYNKFTLSNIGFLLTVDGNFRWLEWKSKFYILIYLDFMRDLILFSEIYNLIFLVYNAFIR